MDPAKRRRQELRIDPTKIDVEDMLDRLEIRNIEVRGVREITFSCPFPGHDLGDMNPSASMNIETTAWQCFSCKERGSTAISFVAKLLDVSFQTAARYIREKYGGEVIDPDQFSMVNELKRLKRRVCEDQVIENQVLPEELLDRFRHNLEPMWDYMDKRGFGYEALVEWEIGFDPESNRVIIPVRDEHGRLVGLKGRSIDGRKPKYLVLGDGPRDQRRGFPRYHKSLVCFGMHRAKEHLKGKPLIIVEGEFNKMALDQMGFPNSTGISGSDLSEVQAQIIRRYSSSAIIFLDWDKSGLEGAVAIDDKLRAFMPLKLAAEHNGDPASMSFDEVVDALANAASTLHLKLVRSHHADTAESQADTATAEGVSNATGSSGDEEAS